MKIGQRSVVTTPRERQTFERNRGGSLKQFISPWTAINFGTGLEKTFEHGLGWIPMVVDVLQSAVADGRDAFAATDSLVTSKTASSIVVRNTGTALAYYQVRAV